MSRVFLFFFLGMSACSQAWSHEAPVPVNEMRWTVDPGQVHVHLHCGFPWWYLNVFSEVTPPPFNWPSTLQQIAKTYFDRHFLLYADGKLLPSQLIACRYSQEVWRYYLGSQMDLDFSYSYPPQTKILSGQATFYKEEADDHVAHDHHEAPPVFETHLTINGAPARGKTLTLDHPEFSFPVDVMLRTPFQRWRDAALDGLLFWENAPWLILLWAAGLLQLYTRVPVRVYAFSVPGLAVLIAVARSIGQTGGYAAGMAGALALVAMILVFALRFYYARLRESSESQADPLFKAQTRFLSYLLLGVALLTAAQHLKTPL